MVSLNQNRHIIGIDPGTQGGIVIINPAHTAVEWFALSEYTNEQIADIITGLAFHHKCLAFIELVHAMQGDGITTAGTFMKAFGFLIGCCLAAGIPTDFVAPQTWQRMMALGVVTGSRKAAHAAKATLLFPDAAKEFKRKRITQETADAFLIAEYGWRKTFMR